MAGVGAVVAGVGVVVAGVGVVGGTGGEMAMHAFAVDVSWPEVTAPALRNPCPGSPPWHWLIDESSVVMVALINTV